MSREYRSGPFWAKVQCDGPDVCWPWVAAVNGGGYGITKHGNALALAHRVAYERTRGPVPDGMLVLHRCDNPPCCNPSHLFIGTHTDNVRDMMAKGRAVLTGPPPKPRATHKFVKLGPREWKKVPVEPDSGSSLRDRS